MNPIHDTFAHFFRELAAAAAFGQTVLGESSIVLHVASAGLVGAVAGLLVITAIASAVFAGDPYNPGHALAGTSVPGADAALVAKSNSKVTISVEYLNPFDQVTTSQVHSSVNTWTTSGQPARPQSISITASPENISLTQGQKIDVTYTITIGPDSKGLYDITLYQICEPLPLAVDYPSSAVSSADFPGANGPHSCPALFLNAVITGYSGAVLTSV